MFKMLYDMNFTYDSSMPVYENKPPSWPYTLDYKIFHDCMIPPCPTKSYPGMVYIIRYSILIISIECHALLRMAGTRHSNVMFSFDSQVFGKFPWLCGKT